MNDIIALRRHLHTIPELAFKEWQTLSFIVSAVSQSRHASRHYLPCGTYDKYKDLINTDKTVFEIEKNVFIDVPALKVIFKFKDTGSNLAFRCDMDALPVKESCDSEHKPFKLDFSSKNGNMHACAHDGHMAIALYLIGYIDRNYSKIKDNTSLASISFIFQCAEEGCRGGIIIAQSDFLDDIDTLYCYHLGMKLPSMCIAANPRNFLATQKFMLKTHGIKAHAGRPDKGVNALLPLCSVIVEAMSYQDIQNSVYINFGNMSSPGASNIVPDFASVFGEIRSNDSDKVIAYYNKLKALIERHAQIKDLRFELVPLGRALDIKNSQELALHLESIGSQAGFNICHDFCFNASEDASLLIDKIQKKGGKAMHFVIGANLKAEHHHSLFDFDESILKKAACLIVKIIQSHSFS